MASLSRQRLVDSLHDAGLLSFTNDQSTDQLRHIYLAYCQAKSEGPISLSDDQLFLLLRAFGANPGPVQSTTRSLYRKKLESKMGLVGGPPGDNAKVDRETPQRPHYDDVADEDLIHIEQKATQVGRSLHTVSDARRETPAYSVPVTPSPIRSGAEIPRRDPHTSTPKQESSAALGLFTSDAGRPAVTRSPPRQSRLLGADFSLSDIPNRAPVGIARRSVWAAPASQPLFSRAPEPTDRAGGILSTRRLKPEREEFLASKDQSRAPSREQCSLRLMLQVITVIVIGLLVFLAYIFLEENPKRPAM